MSIKPDPTPFRRLLNEHGLTIHQFADRFGIPTRTVENWSRGENKLPAYHLRLFRFALDHGFDCRKENNHE